jgi:hypothetical protein
VPVENVFNRHPQVRRSALIEVAGGPALAIEPASWPLTPQARQTLAAELRAVGEGDPVTGGVRRFYFHQSFPVDAGTTPRSFAIASAPGLPPKPPSSFRRLPGR